MRIGYACLTLGLPHTGYRSCTQRTASPDRLRALIGHNLDVLARQVDYNRQHGIRLFRITSDLIPFGGSPVNPLPWQAEFGARFAQIGASIRSAGMRVSMHPGQYTVLSSPRMEVVERAAQDLRYHADVLDALGCGPECKIVLHVGGAYGDKPAALRRFAAHYRDLPDCVRTRLVIENDERCYHIRDILELAAALSIPALYDNLHNQIHPADAAKGDAHWIALAGATWGGPHGPQKIHYAQQHPDRQPGAHAERIRLDAFLAFVDALGGQSPDVMLEVKDKDLSAVKCALALSPERKIRALEVEWARYKYLILERDQRNYQQIRALLKDKAAYPVEAFYQLVDASLQKPPSEGCFENAAQHVWGYFKDKADATEKRNFERLMAAARCDSRAQAPAKKLLWRLTEKYGEAYLQSSLFFL